jgi:hypothetical protein
MASGHAVIGDLGVVSQTPKESVLNRTAQGQGAGEPLKNLPPTAIDCHSPPNFCRRIATTFQRVLSLLPLAGVPASLGPGLRTVSGAVRSLGEKLSPSANSSHDQRIRHQSEIDARGCESRG